MARMNRPAPVEVCYKNMRFLITHNPTNATLNTFLEDLKKYGATTVVRVCEVTYDKTPLEKDGITVMDWPFDDGAPPPSKIVEDWLNLLKTKFCEDPGCCVAVHCVAGLGRAPVLVALALIESGMKYEDAIQFIRQWHHFEYADESGQGEKVAVRSLAGDTRKSESGKTGLALRVGVTTRVAGGCQGWAMAGHLDTGMSPGSSTSPAFLAQVNLSSTCLLSAYTSEKPNPELEESLLREAVAVSSLELSKARTGFSASLCDEVRHICDPLPRKVMMFFHCHKAKDNITALINTLFDAPNVSEGRIRMKMLQMNAISP
ncbi:hypothetical protein HGM15179_006514 [Zosterops borbonicus]|uniref:Protein tyrosine phosphatase type IVA 3 n=2 Tax=Telluraves TaxID=3073808 RepID=A0A8K1GME1_9PASS|nr:hypothetical protein HGM15179_006514 [Zosterops borbonicus]